ncbi:MAG: tetratricopeptide repeat protein [Microcoleaceae cyanobacterium]
MKQLQPVIDALENQDFRQAAQLLKQLKKQSPNDPWVRLYIGRWYEATDKFSEAEKIYRKLLQQATNPKITTQARQGLQRIETIEQDKRLAAISQAKTETAQQQHGILILEPISPEKKAQAAQKVARMLKTDAYTARMQLQSRGWRLYRTGDMAELQVYGQEMRSSDIPVFWVSLNQIQQINVFRVQYFQSLTPQPTVVCQNHQDQLGAITFNWSEVTQRIDGLLPIFSAALDYDPRRPRTERFRHKQMTQDHANIYDLHLPQRRSILRFYDQVYDFKQGIDFSSSAELTTTTRMNWTHLLEVFDQNLRRVTTWSEFTAFAETTLDYTQLLSHLPTYVNVSNQEPTIWEAAFQLYSALVFLKTEEGR